jgi:hypothetical protein
MIRGNRVWCGAMVAAFVALSAPSLAKPRREHATRWYGADPHVPLAVVDAGSHGRIDTIGDVAETGAAASRAQATVRRRACSGWARVGSSWSAVDRWGQVVGARTLEAREFYEPTGCFEATFPDDPRAWSSPFAPGRIVLYASATFRPHPSVEWTPSGAVAREHAAFAAQLTKALVAPTSQCHPDAIPIAGRTMFFRAADAGDPDNHVAARERTFAVSGGCALIVAERTGEDAWHAAYVDATMANQTWSNDHAYLPFAVFDMNDDGWPEVLCHESESFGEFYGDTVISRDEHGAWRLVARSVGGSTA